MPPERAAVNGIELAYEDHGSGERPLVLVHGFTGWRHDFAERLPELAVFGRTIALDQRGHGDSTNTGEARGYSLEGLARDLIGFLDAIGVERCDLLGHSMGGMVALRAVLALPERFASLILMDTAARFPNGIPLDGFRAAWRVAREAGMARLQELTRARSEEDPIRTDADRRLEREWGERYWERHRARFLAMDALAYATLGRALVEQESLEPRLGDIGCPTLVLVGEEDRFFLAPARALARGIPEARLVEIPGAGHSPQLENPKAWTRAIREHLERVRGGGPQAGR